MKKNKDKQEFENNCNKEFGKILKNVRKRYGYTQTELAEKMSLSVSFIKLVEKGEKPATVLFIFDCCNALGIPPQKFFE